MGTPKPKLETARRKINSLAEAYAIGFGAGRLPLAPGTWGALEGLSIVYCIHRFVPSGNHLLLGARSASLQVLTLWTLCLVLGALAIVASDRVAQILGKPDPQEVVADEIVGQMSAFLWVPITPLTLVLGFVLFRVFDISKPFPAGRAEHLPGGYGIIADDLVAGLYAGIVLHVVTWYVG